MVKLNINKYFDNNSISDKIFKKKVCYSKF